MDVKVGCDLVHMGRFKATMKRGGKIFLHRVFTPSELASASKLENLAGIFAAKEAVMKALGETLKLKAGDWEKVEITKKANGRPEVKVRECGKKILSHDLSISHDGEYAIAAAVFMLK